jgi:hypothetical protein
MHIKSRKMRWAGRVARMGEGRNLYRVLVGKPEGKRPLERPRRRWEYGIKMDLREIGWGGGVESPGSGWGPVAGCCECGDELSGSGATELVSSKHNFMLLPKPKQRARIIYKVQERKNLKTTCPKQPLGKFTCFRPCATGLHMQRW